MSAEWKTFAEWKAEGRSVIRGEKSTRIEGVAKFSKDQTGVPPERRGNLYDDLNDISSYGYDDTDKAN